MKTRIRIFAAVLLITVLCAQTVQALKPTEHVRLPMEDGTKLATDIYLPQDAAGPWPAMLVRSTYGRNVFPKGMVNEGYALVVQDVRGMGMSEGEKHVFYTDGWRSGLMDGACTAAWVKRQKWCTGKVGTYGGSALGMTQTLLAPSTKDISAQYLVKMPSDFYHDTLYDGGVFRQNLVTGWLTVIGHPHIIPIYKAQPYYNEFWTYYNSVAKAEDITAPGLFRGGWFDVFQEGVLQAFMSRQERGGEGAKGNNYLIMDASAHHSPTSKDYTFRIKGGGPSTSRIRTAFFDCYLKGDADALHGIPKVHYVVMGDDTPGAPGSEWRSAETWPPFPTQSTPFFLTEDGGLTTETVQADSATLGFTFDPNDPYPSLGGNNLCHNIHIGTYDQRKYSTTRNDLLKFASAPMEAPLESTGRVIVQLYVSSDAPDTDFTAKLLDIYPDGDEREINILDNIRRVKLRDSFEKAAPLLTGPDQIVQIEIDMWSTSWIFNTGHRIGLYISSSNYPRYEMNANTGADHPTEGVEMRIAHNRVHLDAAYPSALILPLRPSE